MPAYSNTNVPFSITSGDQQQVWNAEQPTPGNGGAAASQQVALAQRGADATGFDVVGFFSGAPGAFEIDVQGADDDVDAHYQTISGGNITTVDATNNTFLLEATGCRAKFVRLLMRSRTNAVNVSAFIRR